MAWLTRRTQLWLGSAIAGVATVAVLVTIAPMLDLGAGALTLTEAPERVRAPYEGKPWYMAGSMPLLIVAVGTYALVAGVGLLREYIPRWF